MSFKIGFSDLDTSFVPDPIFNDPIWQRCIDIALRSRSENQRYGALVVLGREIVGEGWNRLLGRTEPFPFRTSFFLHAEKAAIGAAILAAGEKNIFGAVVCVAGFFVKERRPLIFGRATNTCVACTKLYPRFGLQAGFITHNGWAVYPGERAYQNALENQRICKERRITVKQLRQEISI